MRIPGWIEAREAGWREGTLLLDVRVRRWHPGYWWFLACQVARAVTRRSYTTAAYEGDE